MVIRWPEVLLENMMIMNMDVYVSAWIVPQHLFMRYERGVCQWQSTAVVLSANTCVIFSVWRREVSRASAQSRWGFPINKCTESIYTGRGTWRHNTPDILFSGRVAISHTAEWSKYFQYTHAVVYYRMAKALNLAKSSVRKSLGSCCDTFPCVCLLWRSSSVNTTRY